MQFYPLICLLSRLLCRAPTGPAGREFIQEERSVPTNEWLSRPGGIGRGPGFAPFLKFFTTFPPQVASPSQQFSREESRINRGRGNFYIRPAASILDFLKFFFNRISKFLSVSFFFSKLGKLCIKKGEGRGRGN